MDDNIENNNGLAKETRLRWLFHKEVGFRISCIISGKNTRELPKEERLRVGRITSIFIAQSKKDDGFEYGDFYAISWLDPLSGKKYLTPAEFYKSIGIDLDLQNSNNLNKE